MELLWLTSSPRKTDDLSLSIRCHIATSGYDPVDLIRQHEYSAIVVEADADLWASDVLMMLRRTSPAMPLWIFDREATPESAQAWIEAGADRVASSTAQVQQLVDSLPALARPAAQTERPLIGTSPAIQSLASNIALIADKRCNVLIEGETGTGKEVVARAIHASGSRNRGPWVAVNCGAIPEALLEAELFGHVRGAFTGAVQSRAGKFEAASHGTIFLDEIGEMPLAVQARLLRVLQEREVERLGGNERIRLDVRVIAATNASLAGKVRDGLFRQDLFYRLNVFRIAIPPLRERLADIPALADHFVAKFCAADNLRRKSIDARALDQLLGHDWPGNVRELENLIESAVILSGSRPCIYPSDIRFSDTAAAPAPDSRPNSITQDKASVRIPGVAIPGVAIPGIAIPNEGLDYQEALHAFEHSLLTQAIARTRGNKTAAADLLRLKRTTLSARIRTLESRLPRLVA